MATNASVFSPLFMVTTQTKLKLADVGSACVQLISCMLRKRVVGLCPEPVEVSQYHTPSLKKPFTLFVPTSISRKFPDQNFMF